MFRLLFSCLPFLLTCLPLSSIIAQDTPGEEMPGLVTAKASSVIRTPTTEPIDHVLVKDGDWVEVGQPLVQFRDDLAKAALDVLAAEINRKGPLVRARTEIEQKKQRLARLLEVNQDHRLPKNAIDDARNDLRIAEAMLQTAEEDIFHAKQKFELEKTKLSRLTLCAPISGRVSRVRVKSGEQPEGVTEMMRIVNLDHLLVELQIPLTHYDRLSVGEKYQLRGQTPVERDITATLTCIDPVLDSGTMTVRCVFEIDNRDGVLPAGFLVLPPSELSIASEPQNVAGSAASKL